MTKLCNLIDLFLRNCVKSNFPYYCKLKAKKWLWHLKVKVIKSREESFCVSRCLELFNWDSKKSILLITIILSSFIVSQPAKLEKKVMWKSVFLTMASHIKCRFNKNSLLQCYLLAILPAGLPLM